jgi:hypothetical protein
MNDHVQPVDATGGTYTLSVITVQTIVSHHLYQNDQFCGLSGSLGPFQVTSFGSVLGLGRKGSGGADFLFGSGTCGSLAPQAPKRASNVARSSPCKIVDVDECAGEGAALVTVTVRDDEREGGAIRCGEDCCGRAGEGRMFHA